MVLFLLIGLTLAAVSMTLLARAVAMPRVRVAETINRIEDYGYEGAVLDDAGSKGALRGLVDSLAGSVGSLFAGRGNVARNARVRSELMAAGMYATPVRRFAGYRILSAVFLTLVWLWASRGLGASGVLTFLGVVVIAPLAWWAPIVFVRTRAERRLQQIDEGLPELIDILVVAVEAGRGFSGALQIASTRFDGPLGDELRLTLQEQSMGLATNEALRNLLERAETPGMRSFVRSILQGETLGVSIGQIMRELAVEMRKRRRDYAQERAQKAPIKILFPLVFLIFPAMFVILLAPAIFSFMDAIGS